MYKTTMFTVGLMICFCVSPPAIAQHVGKTVTDKQINPQAQDLNTQTPLSKYVSCACRCGVNTINLPGAKDCSSYEGKRCITVQATGATDFYKNCVKVKK